MAIEELVIKVRADVLDAKKNLASLRKDFNSGDGVVSSKTLARAEQGFKNLSGKLRGLETITRKPGFAKLGEGMTEISDIMDDLDDKIAKSKFNFQGWALSIMFAGMAIQRIFSGISKFGVKTFNDIAHSVEGMTTNTDILQGSMTYLGFSIGQALEPVIGWLVPIVEWIANLVAEHPKWTAAVIATGIAIGGLLTVVGGTVLALYGLAEAFSIVFGVNLIDKLKAAGEVFGILKKEILGTFTLLKGMSLVQLLGLAGLITGIALAVIWIFKLKDAMGGWGEFFKSVGRGILRVIALIVEGVIWSSNMMVSVIIKAVNFVIDKINQLLASQFVGSALSKLGMKAPQIGRIADNQYSFGDGVLNKYLDFEQNGALAPSKGYATGSSGGAPTYNINIGTVQSDADSIAKLMEDLKRYGVTQ